MTDSDSTAEPTLEELAAMTPMQFNEYTSKVWGGQMDAADTRRKAPGSPFWRAPTSSKEK